MLKNLQVIPEYPIGSGQLNFLISGHTSEGQIVNICLEFKLAHATDLAHGIAQQLPEYMARRATDFGINLFADFDIRSVTTTSPDRLANNETPIF